MKLNKIGPDLSHLFFVDDLLLFTEASMEQASVIQQCLDDFCDVSRQKVNKDKTRIFFLEEIQPFRIFEYLWKIGIF